MLKQDSFWEKEGGAPLLNKNRGFLKPNEDNKEIIERVQKWPSLMSLSEEKKSKDFKNFTVIGEPDRIFIKDAERTFFNENNRQTLIRILSYLKSIFKDYAQALSYLTSTLLLYLDEETVVEMLYKINFDEKYIPGYWKAEAVAFATDAYVFDNILSKFNPKVHSHLPPNGIFPDNYAQKWFCGLGIHVLPFDALLLFLENFLEKGNKFLFQFGLSFIDHVEEELLKTNKTNELFAILRMDRKLEEEKALSIVKNASNYNLDSIDFKSLRIEMYDKKLRARMERAAKDREEASSDEEDSDEEGGEECGICFEAVPDFYCTTCKVLLCETCHDESKGSHQKKIHKVKTIDDVDLDEITKSMSSLKVKKD